MSVATMTEMLATQLELQSLNGYINNPYRQNNIQRIKYASLVELPTRFRREAPQGKRSTHALNIRGAMIGVSPYHIDTPP